MGGTSKSTQTSTQNSRTAPWSPSQGLLTDILDQTRGQLGNAGVTGAENNALDQITANAGNAGQFVAQLQSLIGDLFNGGGATAQSGNISSNLDTYRNQLTPFANGSMVGNNRALQGQLDTISNDVQNRVNGMFAGAGRDLSGANVGTLARGIAEGTAPVLANQYNQDINNQINAAGQLYGAGNTTAGLLSGLQQQSLANRGAGAQLAPSLLEQQNAGANSVLQAEAARRGIPVQALGLLANIGIPIAGLGSQSSGTGTQTGTQQMSGVQQFQGITSGLNNLVNPARFLFG